MEFDGATLAARQVGGRFRKLLPATRWEKAQFKIGISTFYVATLPGFIGTGVGFAQDDAMTAMVLEHTLYVVSPVVNGVVAMLLMRKLAQGDMGTAVEKSVKELAKTVKRLTKTVKRLAKTVKGVKKTVKGLEEENAYFRTELGDVRAEVDILKTQVANRAAGAGGRPRRTAARPSGSPIQRGGARRVSRSPRVAGRGQQRRRPGGRERPA